MRPHCVSCAEETGVEPNRRKQLRYRPSSGNFYSSEGMTDELANIMVVHLRHVAGRRTAFRRRRACRICLDPVEASLRDTHITASNSDDRHFA